MSAGAFEISKYESNDGIIFPVSVQPETLALEIDGATNSAPTGVVGTGMPSAKVSGSRREIGVNCRLVRIKFTGTLPPGYKMDGILTLPVLQIGTYAAWSRGKTGNYNLNGTDYPVIVVGRTAESVR